MYAVIRRDRKTYNKKPIVRLFTTHGEAVAFRTAMEPQYGTDKVEHLHPRVLNLDAPWLQQNINEWYEEYLRWYEFVEVKPL
jgi:hypothetical protein